MPAPPVSFGSQQNFYQPPTSQSTKMEHQNNEQKLQFFEQAIATSPQIPPHPPMAPISTFTPPTFDSSQRLSQDLKTELNQHIQLSNQMSSGSTGSGPINSSAYQPYLAYGAPPPAVSAAGFQQFSPPASGILAASNLSTTPHFSVQQPPAPLSMPNYFMPNTFIPQPPPTVSNNGWSNPSALHPPIFNNLPMPSLSDLGIKELVPQPASNAGIIQPPASSPSTNVPNQ